MPENDDLTAMLDGGWTVAGYSTCLSTLGMITHHVLLQKGSKLSTVNIGVNGVDEQGRGVQVLAPAPPAKKKGWFG